MGEEISIIPEAAEQTLGVLGHLQQRLGSEVDLTESGYLELARGKVPVGVEHFIWPDLGSRRLSSANTKAALSTEPPAA